MYLSGELLSDMCVVQVHKKIGILLSTGDSFLSTEEEGEEDGEVRKGKKADEWSIITRRHADELVAGAFVHKSSLTDLMVNGLKVKPEDMVAQYKLGMYRRKHI